MHFSALSGFVLALSHVVIAGHSSSAADLDGSVWADLQSSHIVSSHLVKRQSSWSPPSYLVTPLQEVWNHQVQTYSDLYGFVNYGWDQLIANGGYLNYCVRWESNAAVTQAQREQIATVLAEQSQKWFEWLYGFDNFPFNNIQVNIVGWAVRDPSLLQGSSDGIDVYTNTDGSGAPECDPACGRFFHQNGDYSQCPGGAARHYDQSLWLTDGFEGGAGGDWGQRIGREYFMGALNSENIHILLHEIGHTYGLDDFYDWTPTGVSSFIMRAGSATEVTEFDGWMLRNWWYELSRNRGWTSGTTNPTTTTQSTATPTATNGGGNGDLAQQWGQCGGIGWSGPTQCVAPYSCTFINDWYWQCL